MRLAHFLLLKFAVVFSRFDLLGLDVDGVLERSLLSRFERMSGRLHVLAGGVHRYEHVLLLCVLRLVDAWQQIVVINLRELRCRTRLSKQ